MDNYKIIVAHSGKQHSFQTANALNKHGHLYKYITTVYDKPWSWTRLLTFLLIGKNKKKASTRKNYDLKEERIKQFYELRGLILLLASRIPFFLKLFPSYFQYVHNSFGRKVAFYAIQKKVDAVIMYDTDASYCFEILRKKAPHIKRILDASIANRLFLKPIYEQDDLFFKDSRILKEQIYELNRKNLENIEKEFSLANYFLVGSHFVKQSLEYSCVANEQIYIVPYGVNVTRFNCAYRKENRLPLKLIFVGSVLYRKGIHHLLKVVSQFSEKEVFLTIVGGFSQNMDYYRYAKCKNIHFTGFVTHDTLSNLYNQADVFVLPSLAEGFAQVSLEAMSCGLPVICTENSGCNDAVVDFENGFVIKAGDRAALKNRIEWCIQNRDKLPVMGENARRTALNYTWNHYYNNLNAAIEQIMEK
jgi:glycosyltransferase involved in cell wall biosynthesis